MGFNSFLYFSLYIQYERYRPFFSKLKKKVKETLDKDVEAATFKFKLL